MDDGSPGLEVGFAIDTAGSFDSLAQLAAAMDSTEAKVMRDAANIERATGGMLNLAGATASIKSFGNAATRTDQDIIRSRSQVEKSGEALIRSISRQADSFGKTRSEIRGMKADAAALAAEQQGLIELAQRIRTAEAALYDQEFAAARKASQEAAALVEAKAEAAAAAEREAAALKAEAAAAEKLAAEHGRLAAMVRESHDAQVADAAAAERMRAATDPLYAATKRLNAEIAESTRLYYAGATSEAEYTRQQAVLTQRLAATTEQHNLMAAAGRKNAFALQMVGMQVPDIVQGLASGQHLMTIFIQQGGQIAQIGMMAEGGLKGFAAELGGVAVAAAPVIAVVAAAAGGFALFDRAVSSGIDTTAMVNSLGLTRDEIKKLKNTTVGVGDVVGATFEVMAQRAGISLTGIGAAWTVTLDFMTEWGRKSLAALYALFVGTFEGISAVVRDVFGEKGLAQLAKDVDGFGANYANAFHSADKALVKFGADVTAQIKSNKLADLQKQAAAIKLDRTPRIDHHAEQLARDAEATERQITNLYKLADAYGVSGAAALIAEAREKAESQAIKQRGDIEAAVNRQIRLAVAQRVADAAKSTAAMNEQAAVQEAVNAQVAAGLVPASQATQLIQDQIALLPLLAAQQAAQQRGDLIGLKAATDAINNEKAAQDRLNKAKADARYNSAIETGADQLAQLREELRLISANDAARVHALATLKATQEANRMIAEGLDPAKAAAYVAQQAAIADQQQANTDAQRAYNDALAFTADKWDLIARNVQEAGQGMADAFGSAGRALGDLASAYADYRAQEEREQAVHQNNLRLASSQGDIDRENAKHALATATSQIDMYGDMAEAAKGFFKEGSSGYKAMADAEKAFRAIQFALSVKAIAQDAIETGEKLATSAARTAAGAVEAVVNAIKSLPFPANLVAGAATIAALAAIGVSVAGSFGGNHNDLPKANGGTGTVLGDASAKSDSIKNAIDALKEVDTLTNTYAREMNASLKSIDSQIGGLATVLVRAGDINASEGVNLGFKPNLIGSVLGAIPLVGGLLGSLFGTKTSVIGSGLYGGPQSLGDILDSGFDASTYSDIKKKHKFFGITTGTSYKTHYGAADPTLENQFTLILKSFDDAILAAAGPLGLATSDIEQRLNGFVVNIGKIDLKGLTGEQIEDKLEAVFGAAADNMAAAAVPGLEKFQRVGEGAFETLVRVASTVEAVTNALSEMGDSAAALGIDAKMGLAAQFDSISDMTSAVDAYFQAFYTTEEQTAAKTAELQRVFDSLGLTMPSTLDAFRQLVDAQDLTTAAGQETYATLIKLAPAFADLQEALNGAKSAADIASEHDDLQKQLLELQGDTAALRAMQLASLDPSNRALQEQIWAIQDAQDAAKAAQDLADAWTSVGDSIMDEVKRIRGLTDTATGGSFASLMGQFNAATAAARAGDQDAAKSLPQLAQDLLNAANLSATSRQELDRIQAQVAASLEATYAAIMAAQGSTVGAPTSTITSSPAVVSVDTLSALAASQPVTTTPANDDVVEEMKALRAELAQLRSDNVKGHAAVAANTGAIKRTLDNVTAASGGDAVSTVAA